MMHRVIRRRQVKKAVNFLNQPKQRLATKVLILVAVAVLAIVLVYVSEYCCELLLSHLDSCS